MEVDGRGALMKYRYYQKELRKLLISFTIGCTITTIAIISTFNGIYANQIIRTNNSNVNKDVQQVLSEEFTHYLDFLEESRNDELLVQFFSSTSRSQEVYKKLYTFNVDRSIENFFYLVDTHGHTVLTNNISTTPYSGPYIYVQQLFKEMRDNRDVAIVSNKIQVTPFDRTVCSFGVAIRQEGQVVGYLILDILEQDLMRLLEERGMNIFTITDTYYNSIVTSNNSILDRVGKLSIIKQTENYVDLQGTTYYYQHSNILADELYLTTFSALRLAERFVLGSLLFVGISIVVVIFMVVRLSEVVTRRKAEAIEAQISADTRLAELKQLEAHFNPHFIFNTLETLKYLVQFNKKKSVQLIINLSKILRYSIDRERRFVQFLSDLDYIESYLQLQKFRYQDRLVYTIEHQEEAETIEVPKLILQPLVENAIVHGYKQKENLTIHIRVYLSGDTLLMEVKDTGEGIPKDKLEELENRLHSTEEVTSKHTGVYNVHKRIQLLYGDQYGLTIESNPGVGTLVIVRMPLDTTTPLVEREVPTGQGAEL